MKLETKVTLAAVGAVVCSLAISLVHELSVLRAEGTNIIFDSMRSIVVAGEEIRAQTASMDDQGIFRSKELLEEAKKGGDIRLSKFYRTIPIVNAWTTISKAAASQGYEFRVVKKQARNPKNQPTPEEEELLNSLESGKMDDLRKVDSANNLIIYARPIRLTADCLSCHGDPKASPTGDGKDALGFAMENWKAGEIHGAFILKANTSLLNGYIIQGFNSGLWVIILSMGAFAVLLLVTMHYGTKKYILGPIQKAINTLKSDSEKEVVISGEISSSSTRLAEAATEQAASLEETSATLEELSGMTRRNAEHADASQLLAADTRKAADMGAQDMQAMVHAMQEIKSASNNIAAIIKTIDEIAFQTNILALNAAVEAARAGEAGAGFAVVAEEVRALAQRSASAAKETASKIEDSIKKSEHGVVISSKVSQSLSEILERARKLDSLVTDIASGSKEQAQGIAQVNEVINQLDKVTQQNAATAEESASAATELKASSDQLDLTITDLIHIVGAGMLAIQLNDSLDAAITKAIGAHGMWKDRIKVAIATGKTDVPVDVACQDDKCAFGKWLYGMEESKRTNRWKCVRQQHAQFHKKAGSVLDDALSGRKREAQSELMESGEFFQISTKLTKELMDWAKQGE